MTDSDTESAPEGGLAAHQSVLNEADPNSSTEAPAPTLPGRAGNHRLGSDKETAVLDRLMTQLDCLGAKPDRRTALLEELLAKADSLATNLELLRVTRQIEATNRKSDFRRLMRYVRFQMVLLLIVAGALFAWWTPVQRRAWCEFMNSQAQTVESSSAAAAPTLTPPSDLEPQHEASVTEAVVEDD